MPAHQSTRWCFTINNPTDADRDAVAQLGNNRVRCKYLVVGREQGELGTPHLQGFCVLTSGATRTRISSWLPRGHFEQTRGSSVQAGTYCKKDGDFDEYGTCPLQSGAGTVLDALYEWGDAYIAEHGHAPSSPEIAKEHPTAYLRYPRCVKLFQNRAPPPAIREGDTRDWQTELEEALENEADDRSVLFMVDDEGGKGKTWFQQYYLTKYPNKTQILSVGKRDDLAHYIQEDKTHFMFNIPRGGMEFMQYTILEQLKDRMIFSPKYQSTTKVLRKAPHVVVFCNEEPDYSKMTEDRYVVKNI